MTGYIPTSMPVSMMDGPGIRQGDITCMNTKVEFDEDIEQGRTQSCMQIVRDSHN